MRQEFTDLDDYGDAVHHARVELCMFRPEYHRWSMSQHPLGPLLLQLGAAGGGNICRGESRADNPILFLPLSNPSIAAANGTQFDGRNAMLLPPGAEFFLLHKAAHAWCSLSFPAALWPASPEEVEGEPASAPLATCAVRSCVPDRIAELARLAVEYDRIETTDPDRLAHPAARQQATADFQHALERLLATVISREPPHRGRPLQDRRAVMIRLHAELEASARQPLTAPELAQRVGIAERTLRQICRETLGVGPTRYLNLRQLRNARHQLRDRRNPAQSVTEILSSLGIWQFGRFAGEYRRVYGELPSQTFREARRYY